MKSILTIALLFGPVVAVSAEHGNPNIVVIMVDDKWNDMLY